MLLSEFNNTLQYHDTLNTKLFDSNDKLKSVVIDKLIYIAKLFVDECKIPPSVIDYYLVGGNANFNYTNLSDIDIHIILDKSKINSGDIDLDDYYKDKKDLWASTHNITIYDYPVELYIQDINEVFPENQGVYSIFKNKFIIKPSKVVVDYYDPKVISKTNKYIDKINNADMIEQLRTIKDKLKLMRTIGLRRGGEFSIENLIFKQLRNLGYVEKLQRKYQRMRDSNLSL